MKSMIRFKEDRHDVRVEQKDAHCVRTGDWRRICRTNSRNVSTSSGWPRSLCGSEYTGGFAPGTGTGRSGNFLGSATTRATFVVYPRLRGVRQLFGQPQKVQTESETGSAIPTRCGCLR
jgi:hypothetical protein